jgi:hypothetical protein
MRRYVNSLPGAELEKPFGTDGHTFLQRAADAGATKVVAVLLDHGARKLSGLGNR